ncbi:MAG: hypothetical protein ACI8P0_003956 [Planctomycetaceae bacterium]|jgi:hypothetical protein
MSGQYIADMGTPEMNHPIVKKLLRNELLMWGLGVLVVVALPMGVVVLEATTSTSKTKTASKSKPTDKSKKRTAASKLRTKAVAVAQAPLFEDNSAEITDGVLDPESVFESEASDEVHRSAQEGSIVATREVSGELAEVSSENLGAGILYFGGEPAGVSHEEMVEVAASEVVVTSSPATDEGVNTTGLTLPADATEEADPDLIALLAGGEQKVSKTEEKVGKTVDSPESSVKDDEDKEDTRERTQVTLLRPKGEVVKSVDDVIFRCKTREKLFPFVLVRSRQKSAPWWVQNDTLRQGTYVRGRAQFGNRATLDGSRFSVLVAFVEDIEDVPEPGTQMAEIPEDILISQELEFTLRK